jgi:hypothetical protein
MADERIPGHFKLAQTQTRPFDFKIFQNALEYPG